MNVELHLGAKWNLGAKLHSEVELQSEAKVHSDTEISVHERNVELPDREVHSDSEVDRLVVERREEPRLSKYVKDITLLNKLLEIKKLD